MTESSHAHEKIFPDEKELGEVQRMLKGHFSKKTPHSHDVEDYVQATFQRVLEMAGNFRGNSKGARFAWILKNARTVYFNSLRDNHRKKRMPAGGIFHLSTLEKPDETIADEDADLDPAVVAMREEHICRVRAFLENVQDPFLREMRPFLERFAEGESVAEMSQQQNGKNPHTFRRHFRQARQKFRELFAQNAV